MITRTVVEWFLQAVTWIVEGLPQMPANIEAFFDDFLVRLEQLVGIVGVWGYAIPWNIVGFSITVSLWGVGIAITVKLVRIVASFLTLGGGM